MNQRRKHSIVVALLVLAILVLIVIFDVSLLWFVAFAIKGIIGWIEWAIGCVGYYLVSIFFPETP